MFTHPTDRPTRSSLPPLPNPISLPSPAGPPVAEPVEPTASEADVENLAFHFPRFRFLREGCYLIRYTPLLPSAFPGVLHWGGALLGLSFVCGVLPGAVSSRIHLLPDHAPRCEYTNPKITANSARCNMVSVTITTNVILSLA